MSAPEHEDEDELGPKRPVRRVFHTEEIPVLDLPDGDDSASEIGVVGPSSSLDDPQELGPTRAEESGKVDGPVAPDPASQAETREFDSPELELDDEPPEPRPAASAPEPGPEIVPPRSDLRERSAAGVTRHPSPYDVLELKPPTEELVDFVHARLETLVTLGESERAALTRDALEAGLRALDQAMGGKASPGGGGER